MVRICAAAVDHPRGPDPRTASTGEDAATPWVDLPWQGLEPSASKLAVASEARSLALEHEADRAVFDDYLREHLEERLCAIEITDDATSRREPYREPGASAASTR